MALYKKSVLICREEGQSRNKFAITLCYPDGCANVSTCMFVWGCANLTLTGDRWCIEIGKFRVNLIRDNLQWCEQDLGQLMWHHTELEAAVTLFEGERKGNGISICCLELHRKDILTRAVAWLEGSRIITLNWISPILGSQFPLPFQTWEDAEGEGALRSLNLSVVWPCLGKIYSCVFWISSHLFLSHPPSPSSGKWELVPICLLSIWPFLETSLGDSATLLNHCSSYCYH